MDETKIPRDDFSTRRRQLEINPAAIVASSRVDILDFYGNLETWTIDTFRADGDTTAFIQRMSADGAIRLVLPPQIMRSLARQTMAAVDKLRSRAARKAVDTRRSRGDVLGNKTALENARKARRKK
jgi:hypothetical protein